MLGDEFLSEFELPKRKPSPLAADIPGAATSSWSSAPRPSVTAWEGADQDAYYHDKIMGVWRHCQTGAVWSPPITLEQATASFCDALMAPYRDAAE